MSLDELDEDVSNRRESVAADHPATDGDDQTDAVEQLRRENAQLRKRYEDLRQSQYRRTSLALFGLGVAGVAGAALVPPVRETLLVLGAIGLFAAAVTRYLSSEQFIPIHVGSSVFQTHAENYDALVDELGLQDTRVYVPDTERETVRLFVPESRSYTLPASAVLRDTFVITEDDDNRGVAFNPSGVGLFDEFEQHLDGPLGDDPTTLARQSADALVELFELVDAAETETDRENGRVTVRVDGCRFATGETFDTPVVSFLAVTLARGLDAPVTTDVTLGDDADFAVTCRWDAALDSEDEPR